MQVLAKVLKLSAGGMPVAWVDWRRAVCLYLEDKVLWEAGEEPILLRGGWNRETGQRSTFSLSPIIAVNDRSRIWEQGGVFPLTRRRLYARDHGLCLYCGDRVSEASMTIDHVLRQLNNMLQAVKSLIFRGLVEGNTFFFGSLCGVRLVTNWDCA